MANKRYIVTKSNYTLKEKHKELKNGNTIYERDYMTTTNLGGWDSGVIPYGESNFKFVHNQNPNSTRGFNNGAWLNHDGNPIWTLQDVSQSGTKEESKIVIKPNKNSFGDFAYFGSCVELLHVSLKNIIEYYPGELYITDNNFVYTDNDGNSRTLGSDAFSAPVVVSNPLLISLTKTIANTSKAESDDYNELRYFRDSFDKYVIVNRECTEECIIDVQVVSKNKKCYADAELISNITIYYGSNSSFTINEYYFPGGNILITEDTLSGWRIRPTEGVIENIFDTKFSDFEQFLLNRDSKPIYTIDIDVPSETNIGIKITRRKFTFPTIYGWNLDLESSSYNVYVSNLLTVAKFYDEHYSNNLWENIVHESIKNKDITYSNPSRDEDRDDYILGIGNVHGLMLAYGRQFDDIKLAIENIKTNNTVTYDENNNIPDYFLSDTLNLSGWEVTSVVKTLDETATVDNLFPGETKEYTTEELNTIFMRNLKINSRGIFTRKNTRQAVEMLLALFGLSSYEFGMNYYNCLPESEKIIRDGRTLQWNDLTEQEKSDYYDYKFNEYVVVAHNTAEDIVDSEDTLCIEDINQQIKGDRTLIFEEGSYGETIELVNTLIGLPVRMVYLTHEVSGETQTLKYLIPWFDKAVEYDGKTYFQMYGGWNKIDGEPPYYEETLKYLKIVNTIPELLGIPQSELREGEIYYVTDISDYKDYFPSFETLNASNYFYLQGLDSSYKYGIYDTTANTWSDGWQIIPEVDVRNKTSHGIEVYQLESIIDDYTGNNPHVGYGNYDSGEKYLTRLSHVFDGAFDDGLFTECSYICNGDEIDVEDIKQLGFQFTNKLVDNVKCWYFVDSSNTDKMLELRKKYTTISDGEITKKIAYGYEEKNSTTTIYVGQKAQQNGMVHNTTNLVPFDFETQTENSNDESAAYSVVNTKNISIEFNSLKYNNDEFEQYLHKAIIPYLNQIIPTTSIMEIKYFRNNEFDVCYNTPAITGVSK